MRPAGDWQLFRRLAAMARPYWLHLTGLFALSLLSAPLALLAPLPLKLAVDSVIGTHPLPGALTALFPSAAPGSAITLAIVAVMLVVVAGLTHLQELGTSVLRTWTGDRLTLGFRAQLFRHLQRLSLSFHDRRGSSDSLYRVLSDAPALQYVAIDGIIPFVTAAITLITVSWVMLRIDLVLALVALSVGPVIGLISRRYRRRLRHQSRAVKEAESSAQAVVQEVLQAVRVVKAFGQEDREEERFRQRASAGVSARIRLTLFEGRYALYSGMATALCTAVVLYVGVTHVRAGTLTMGGLLLVMGYLGQLYAPIKTIGRKAASLATHLTSAERAFAVLDETPDVPERSRPVRLERARGAIRFEGVSFAYGDGKPVLSDVSFEVAAGARIGITGATGAGKTTLVNLLTRFYDPTSGRIELDGVDLRDYRLADLRNQFAIVLQEPVLFSTSIGENIAYGRAEAGFEAVEAAAKAARIHDFITSLPDGYDTVVGERGMRLSGGERQRVSLARAFLKDAPILILDEPTSSVDVATEAGILESMRALMQGRTTFMIAHRLNTLDALDARIEIVGGTLRRSESAELPDNRWPKAVATASQESGR